MKAESYNIKRNKKCCHTDTYFLPEPWPTDEIIEVCNCCGFSRAHWEWEQEQEVSHWLNVDIYKSRIKDTPIKMNIPT